MINKITEKDRENLIKKRIELVDENKDGYAFELFELWFKDVPKENYRSWKNYPYKTKVKIMKKIIKMEDSSVLKMGTSLYKLNINKVMKYVNDFKIQQLKELGIKKDE